MPLLINRVCALEARARIRAEFGIGWRSPKSKPNRIHLVGARWGSSPICKRTPPLVLLFLIVLVAAEWTARRRRRTQCRPNSGTGGSLGVEMAAPSNRKRKRRSAGAAGARKRARRHSVVKVKLQTQSPVVFMLRCTPSLCPIKINLESNMT